MTLTEPDDEVDVDVADAVVVDVVADPMLLAQREAVVEGESARPVDLTVTTAGAAEVARAEVVADDVVEETAEAEVVVEEVVDVLPCAEVDEDCAVEGLFLPGSWTSAVVVGVTARADADAVE